MMDSRLLEALEHQLERLGYPPRALMRLDKRGAHLHYQDRGIIAVDPWRLLYRMAIAQPEPPSWEALKKWSEI